ncbi:hypothetical protein N7493_006544 [Penicillium malachiteum]|uniref:Uncharacterized protein n=1 Tax=Penicillium malachiteum TaxID=1324776 RepID=A0AAD6MVT1_9EURO|nr:hypothetical protein N7493_006544 [Penicillium malachiteum]
MSPIKEFGACTDEKCICGLSAIGGQVQSVYVEGGVQSGEERGAPTASTSQLKIKTSAKEEK